MVCNAKAVESQPPEIVKFYLHGSRHVTVMAVCNEAVLESFLPSVVDVAIG